MGSVAGQDHVRELCEKVALGSRVLAKLELVDYLGHVSARLPGGDRVYIRSRGTEQGNQLHMTADQVAIVDLEAQKIEGPFPQPDETKLHTEIYKARPDVTAVVHTHQPMATIFGAVDRPILPMQGVMAQVCEHEISIYPSSLKVRTTVQGAEVARLLGDRPIVHLRNHGIAIAGHSVEEVVINAIWLEHQAKMTLWASLLGTPHAMSREEVLAQSREGVGLEGRWRYYVSLLDD